MRISRDWLNHTITIEPFMGEGAYGPVLGPPVEYPARVEHGIKTTLGASAIAVNASARIFLEPEVEVVEQSQIGWADHHGTLHTYTVAEVAIMQGLDAPSHLELLVV